jgi:hypothetical protein
MARLISTIRRMPSAPINSHLGNCTPVPQPCDAEGRDYERVVG